MNNLELFLSCLNHPEEYVEKAYQKELIIIPKEKGESNKLTRANNDLIEKITAYKVAREYHNFQLCKSIIDGLIEILETQGINNAEFTNYWGIHDISYSIYAGFSYEEKKSFLESILSLYIENRHGIYQSHGYTATSLQVRCDSVAHKRSGGLGANKVIEILEQNGIHDIHDLSFHDFLGAKNGYILSDSNGSHYFDELIANGNILFSWGQKHQGKRPDFVIKQNHSISIVEHKHMKEGGGGQNKQIVEVIDFISQNEENVSYITFLDGPYFNKFCGRMDQKILNQFNQIQENLRNNPNNYFVNTYGFRYLFGA